MRRQHPLLRITGLSARIGAQQVVENVSLEVPARGVTALLGRNGVGKTSTIKAVLGLIERDGVVELDGERIDALPTHQIVQRGVGYVPEDREVFGSPERRGEPAPGRARPRPAPRPGRRPVPRHHRPLPAGGRHPLRRAAADGRAGPSPAQREPAAAGRRAHQGPLAQAGRRGRRRARARRRGGPDPAGRAEPRRRTPPGHRRRRDVRRPRRAHRRRPRAPRRRRARRQPARRRSRDPRRRPGGPP